MEIKTYKKAQNLIDCSAKMTSNVLEFKNKNQSRRRKPAMTLRSVPRFIWHSQNNNHGGTEEDQKI